MIIYQVIGSLPEEVSAVTITVKLLGHKDGGVVSQWQASKIIDMSDSRLWFSQNEDLLIPGRQRDIHLLGLGGSYVAVVEISSPAPALPLHPEQTG